MKAERVGGRIAVAMDASALRGGRSGIGIYVERLLEALPAAGVEPLPFSNRRVPGWPSAHRRPLRPTALWTAALAERQAEALRPDLVHYPTGRASRAGRLPRVVTVHDLWPIEAGPLLPWRERWLTAPGLRRGILGADRIIAVSGDTARAIGRHFPLQARWTTVIPEAPTLDPGSGGEPAQAVRASLGLSADQPYCLHVGTLERRKRLDLLVAAIARARRHLEDDGVPAARLPALVLVGADGGEGAALARLAAREGMAPALTMTGYVDRARLADLYRHAGVYVALSLHEGFGLAVLDALAFGLPVVSSGAGALRALSGPSEALLVPDPRPDGVAGALLDLLRNPDLGRRLGEAGRRRAAGFSWAATAGATAALYRELLAEQSGRPGS